MSERAIRYLRELGAGEFAHVNGPLAQHLLGTHALLRQWGCREALCLAGLYHAVYGTAGIRGALASLALRPAIAHVIGIEAESLAYLYGACAREAFHPRIGTPHELLFADRFRGADYAIGAPQLRDLCEITLANELELASAGEAFRLRHRAELAGLFERMRGRVGDAAVAAYRRTLR